MQWIAYISNMYIFWVSSSLVITVIKWRFNHVCYPVRFLLSFINHLLLFDVHDKSCLFIIVNQTLEQYTALINRITERNCKKSD